MQVLAFMALGADATGEEEAKEGSRSLVSGGPTRVGGNVAATYSGGLGEVCIFAVATRPFVVPDVKDCASLWGGG
jgi:hypothetical protein